MNELVRLSRRAWEIATRYIPKGEALVYDPKVKHNLLIFDDIFPHPFSDWRINEHTHYLENIPDSIVYTGAIRRWDILLGTRYFSDREQYLQLHSKVDPKQLQALERKTNVNTKLGYCLFLHNMVGLLPFYEKHNIPFAFTLYPGGGFQLYHFPSVKTLKRIFNSPLFRHVFVNMPFVYNYLVEEIEVPAEKVTLIFSVPLKFDENLMKADLPQARDNGVLKVYFVAHKYSEYGLDKGFDTFCKVARAFEDRKEFSFKVIGNFSEADMSVPTYSIEFLGSLLPDQLYGELKTCDVIVSPNRSYVLQHGAFDGFPTSSVVHSSMCGALMMASDSLDNAPLLGLKDYEHLLLISDRPSEVCEKLEWVLQHPEKSREIARNGRKKMMELCNFDRQLETRLSIIKALIND